jgi:hypothetical protein
MGLAGLLEGERSGRPRRLNEKQLDAVNKVLRGMPREVGLAQYCSLNDPDSPAVIEATRALPLPRPQRIVAHLALYSALVDHHNERG